MIIKNWNNYDWGVYKIVKPRVKKFYEEELKKLYSPKELAEIKKISQEFGEQLGLEFAHNLKRGWENKLLAVGRVLSKDGQRQLKTKEEIRQKMSEDGEVQFFSRRKNGSLAFVKTIKKPAGDCWD